MSGFLDDLAFARHVAVDDLLAGRPLVVLAPHPDDETLGCGALLAVRIAALRPDIALAFYPICGRFTDRTAPAQLIRASDAARAVKVRALACHATQMTALIDADPGGFVMTRAHQAHFLTHPEIVLAP